MRYLIIGIYQGKREVVDEADDRQTAETLRNEYSLAFGREWILVVEEEA